MKVPKEGNKRKEEVSNTDTESTDTDENGSNSEDSNKKIALQKKEIKTERKKTDSESESSSSSSEGDDKNGDVQKKEVKTERRKSKESDEDSSSTSDEDSSNSEDDNKNEDIRKKKIKAEKQKSKESRNESSGSSGEDSSNSEDDDNKEDLRKKEVKMEQKSESDNDSSSSSSEASSKSNDNKDVVKKLDSLKRQAIEVAQCTTKLTEFMSDNKLNSIHSKITSALDILDGEIFLVQIPKCVNPNILLNQQVDLNEQRKIKTKEGSYVLNVQNLEQEPSVFISNVDKSKEQCGAKIIYPQGIITIHQNLKSKRKSDISTVPEVTNVPYPIELKVRHPLFGRDYEKKIVLNENVRTKLLQTNNVKQKKSRKRAHSASKELDENNDDNILVNMFKEQEDKLQKKKKKKSKSMDDHDVSDNLDGLTNLLKNETNFNEPNRVSQKKKLKSDENTIVANSTMINNQTIYFENDLSHISVANSAKKKKKHKNTEDDDDDDARKLILNQLEMDLISNIVNNSNSIGSSGKHKQKKKKRKQEDD